MTKTARLPRWLVLGRFSQVTAVASVVRRGAGQGGGRKAARVWPSTDDNAARRRGWRRAAGNGLERCALGTVLGGLVLMHGLSVHGAHSAMPTTAAELGMATPETLDLVASPAHEHGALEVLCLAVLPIGLLLLLRRTASRAARRGPAGSLLTLVPRPRGRSPDPPSPALLSICRC